MSGELGAASVQGGASAAARSGLLNRVVVPTAAGAYRWYYVDVSGGDYSAVFIFMVGSVFSPRYARAARRGGLPHEHAAVNFALYHRGERVLWTLTEYDAVSTLGDGAGLRIGRSTFAYQGDGLRAEVRDHTAPFALTQWGAPVDVELTLTPDGPAHDEVRLVDGLSHFWRPIAARAHGTVRVPSHGVRFEGRAYHDGNHGAVPLGTDLRGWEWVRRHEPERTVITYRPWADGPAVVTTVTGQQASSHRQQLPRPPSRRTTWGLQVPLSLGLPARPSWAESSPFYARGEAEDGGVHALGEVADFGRFHQPLVQWMAGWRTRAGARR